MPIAELADNDYNLNIRRYVDTTPSPEPQDVRAHLHGGVPKAEVAAKAEQFAAYGIDVSQLFAERDVDYYDFPAEGHEAVAARIPELAAARERELVEAYNTWWGKHEHRLVDLPETKRLMKARTELLDSFGTDLLPVGVLDRFQLGGAIAAWWSGSPASSASCILRTPMSVGPNVNPKGLSSLVSPNRCASSAAASIGAATSSGRLSTTATIAWRTVSAPTRLTVCGVVAGSVSEFSSAWARSFGRWTSVGRSQRAPPFRA